jgi:hypothetical protein
MVPQNELMRVVVTRIEPDGTLHRLMVDTGSLRARLRWHDLTAQALAAAMPAYRPVPGVVIYHVRVDDHVAVIAEHDLTGPLLDLITAVLAFGDAILASPGRAAATSRAGAGHRWLARLVAAGAASLVAMAVAVQARKLTTVAVATARTVRGPGAAPGGAP